MQADIWAQFCQIAESDPDHPAIIHCENVLCFGEFQRSAVQVASRLLGLGLTPGQPCILWAENSPAMAIAILGIIACGSVPTILDAESPNSHFLNAVKLTGARIAIVDAKRFDKAEFEGLTLDLRQIACVQDEGTTGIPRVTPAASDPASIVFTSGSSGLPKGVVQSHANLIRGCTTVAGLQMLSRQDRIICAIPWAFDYGWGQLLSTVLLGVTQILPEKRGSFSLCDAIATHRPTVLPGVPSLFANLIQGLSPIKDIDRSSIRIITNTGSKIPSPLLPKMIELFPTAEISLNFGLSETYRSCALPTALTACHPDSVGFAIPGVAITVLGEDGREVPAGEVGEIIHRGAGVFLGYWGEPEKTLKTRRNDPLWSDPDVPAEPAVFTGDLGWKDDEGRLYVTGRRDRQIKSMGVRVSPDEIEQLIDETGLVSEVAIIARPHEVVGQQVIAVVTLKNGEPIPLKALKKSARDTMSPFMQPMQWCVAKDLPRTVSGKIDYPAIVKRYGNDGLQ